MDNITSGLLNPYVLLYGVSIVMTQLIYTQWRRKRRAWIVMQRRTRGLSDDILLSQSEQLIARRQHAFIQSVLLLLTALGLPFLLSAAISLIEGRSRSALSGQLGLTVAAIVITFILLWSAKRPLQAFVGGLSFKLLAVFLVPFEIGDRITIKGLTGRVTHLGTFLLELETTEGKQISLPTYSLWSEIIAIVPERAIRCETILQLSLETSQQQRRFIESFLQEAVQASIYSAPSKPVQVYFSIVSQKIQVTVVAYAVAEEHAMTFKSEVTSAFLAFIEKEQIAL